MDRKEYKQAFDRERYERIELKVPKGMKSIIKSLANDKGMSVNAYLQDLVNKDQSVSEKSFPQSASPTLRYILPSFGCRSPLRRPYSDKISHKPGLAAHEKPFSDTLQCGMFDTMQIAEGNREMISGITGNMHDGYDIIFKDGYSCHCRTKKDVRSCIIDHCTEKGG